ncbi:hypothetical protein ACWGQ5_41965 [Streptomyces sp. NPDC055722]
MTTDTATTETTGTTTAPQNAAAPRLFRPAGRHRKPRPRRVALLAVGGIALAAGGLSLIRLAPEGATAGGGMAAAEPRIDATDTAVTVETTLPHTKGVSRSATTITRAARPASAPTADLRPSRSSYSHTARATDPTTGMPEAPWTPTASRSSHPPQATTPSASWPTPTEPPDPTTQAPSPSPDQPGLCVPIIGLCVGLPGSGG